MLEVDAEKFAELEAAILSCLRTLTIDGLRVAYAVKKYRHAEVQNAAAIALMALTSHYVKPTSLHFTNLKEAV